MSEIIKTHPVIVYDGECGMCSHWVKWLIKKRISTQVRFISNTDSRFLEWVKTEGIDIQDSIYWLYQDKIRYRSRAIVHIIKYLPVRWHWLYVFLWWPTKLSDRAYDWIAKRRKQIIKGSCQLPNKGQTKYFL